MAAESAEMADKLREAASSGLPFTKMSAKPEQKKRASRNPRLLSLSAKLKAGREPATIPIVDTNDFLAPPGRNRTCDHLLKRELLYRLSYGRSKKSIKKII